MDAAPKTRSAGIIPTDTALKLSALVGAVNPASYAVYERLGADSINVPSDLTPDHLTEMRRVSAAPMDIAIEAPATHTLAAMCGCCEVAELVRRGARCIAKFGLSKAPGIYPYGHHLRKLTLTTAKGGCGAAGSHWTCSRGTGRTATWLRSARVIRARSTGSRSRHNVPETSFTKKTRPRTIPHTCSRSIHPPAFLAYWRHQTEPGTHLTRMMTMRNRRAALAATSLRRLPRPHA